MTLTHDHHHGLSHARKLKLAAGSEGDDRLQAARAFAEFFRSETLIHFAEEEDQVFPLATKHSEEARDIVARLLDEHAEMRRLADELGRGIAAGEVEPELLKLLGETLEAHIRVEEKELFPLLEATVPDAELGTLSYAPRNRGSAG